MKHPIRVLCVDDHQFLVEGLRTRFELETGLEFAGWLPTADELLRSVERLRPTIVLLDIEMPGSDPFEVLGDLARMHPEIRVIMLSAFVRDHFIDRAVKAGAWGYLSKGDEPDSVVKAIRAVAAGEFAFGPDVLERCAPPDPSAVRRHTQSTEHTRDRPSSRLDLLTPREIQILRLIGKGLGRLEIAEAIHRSPKTVDNHRAAIMEKLEIHDRVELARYAIREGIADVD